MHSLLFEPLYHDLFSAIASQLFSHVCWVHVSLNCFILIRDSWIKAAGQFWIHVTLACLANKQQEGGMGVNAMSASAWLNCPFPCLQATYKREDLRFIFLSIGLILSKPMKKSFMFYPKHSHPFNKCRFVLMCEFFYHRNIWHYFMCWCHWDNWRASQIKERSSYTWTEEKWYEMVRYWWKRLKCN